MQERYLGKVLLLFACISVIAFAALLNSLQKTRSEYSNKAPLTINLLLQSDHAIDQFANALRNLERTRNNPNLALTEISNREKKVRIQFDILWSTLKDFNFQFPYEDAPAELAESMRRDIDVFLIDNESLMSPSYSLTQQDIQTLLYRSDQVADDTRQLGQRFFINTIHQADMVEQQISQILNYIGLFIASFLITAAVAIGFLNYNNRRTTKLFNERKSARAELAATVDELTSGKREQKAKDSFIASASHDLRQPLHALGIFLNNLETNVSTEGRKALTGALSCAEDLNRLFNSLLDLSRLDAGVVKVENENFNLRKTMSKLHAELLPKATAYEIDMSLNFHGESSFAHSDPVLVDRIVRNLIENAIVHSQATRIDLIYDCLPEGCRITISDNGCGIPQSEHDEIFSEYYQLQNPERDRSKGLGLGLSIVKRLTSLLEVKLGFSSSEETGTQFKILLPKSTVQPSLNDTVASIVPISDFSSLAGAVIVVIEDDSNIKEAMHMMLSKHSAIVVCGETSDEALEALAEKQLEPDFIIADFRLRDHLTGDAVITQLREAVESDIPALVITGDTSPTRLASLKESGFDILHKPVEAEPFYQKIIDILNQEPDNDTGRTSAAV